MKRRVPTSMLLLMLAAAILWTAPLAWAAGENTLVVGIEEDVSSLDPAKGLGTHTLRTVGNIFDSLVMTYGGSPDIKPSLATSWEISDDGLEYIFHLRQGVKYHDGTPFDADSVKLNIDRTIDPNNPYHFPPYPFPPFWLRAMKEIQVVDPMTVKFILKVPAADFLANLIWSTEGMVSPKAIKEYGPDLGDYAVGTGPFKLVSWEKGVRLVLEANDEYWGGRPAFDRLIFKPIVENASRLTQLQSGEVDVIVAMTPEFIPIVEADPNLQIVSTPGLHTWFISINTQLPPLNDVRVRKAVNYAINKGSIIEHILKGAASPSSSPIWPDTWPAANLDPYPYDPEKARALLKEAGLEKGFSTVFLVPESGSGMIAPKEIATVVQSDLKNVGITAEIRTMEWVSYMEEYSSGLTKEGKAPIGLAQMSWMVTSPDPGLMVNFLLTSGAQPPGGWNNGYYQNGNVDGLLADALKIVDHEERGRMYKEFQRIVHDEAPWIFMFHGHNVVAANKRVKGLVPNPNMNNLHFNTVTLD